MNLEDLKTENPQAAVEQMCGMSDSELNEVSAHARGWKSENSYLYPDEDPIAVWVDPSGVVVPDWAWEPASELTQALKLARHLTKNTPYIINICIHSLECFQVELAYEYVNQATLEPEVPTLMLDETKADSIARAVTILACVGLLFGGSN